MNQPAQSTGRDPILEAIAWCDAKIKDHKKRAFWSACVVIGLFVLFAVSIFLITPKLVGLDLFQPGIWAYSAVSILFGVFSALGVSLYQLHARQVIAIENSILDLHRIAIATIGFENPGFKTDVRVALTRDLFENRSDKALKIRGVKNNDTGSGAGNPVP